MKLKRIFAAVTAFALCASLAGCGAAATVSESAAESAAESAVESTPAVTEAPRTPRQTTSFQGSWLDHFGKKFAIVCGRGS